MASRGSSKTASPPKPQDGLQPFQCPVCQKRFTRHENLKRHSALHGESDKDVTFPCFHCSTIFSRRDLRRRHIKRKHPEASLTGTDGPDVGSGDSLHQTQLSTTSNSDTRSGNSRTRTTSVQPAGEYTSVADFHSLFGDDMLDSLSGDHMSIEELLSAGTSRGSKNSSSVDVTNHQAIAHEFPLPSIFELAAFSRVQPPIYSPPIPTSQALNTQHVNLGVSLFFDHVAHVFPFLHRPTFDSSTTPEPLLMGILSLGLLYMEDDEQGSRLAKSCFHRGRELLETDHLQYKIASGLELHAIQACLLLEMHAIMSTCGFETAYGLRIHTRSIELARIGGLAEPLPGGSTASDLDSLWRQFVRIESHKRTFFVLYQFDVMWYHILSIPRTISHLEIKLELPCPPETWTAPTSADWAHRSLTSGNPPNQGPSRYIQAVRTCMSPNSSTCLPKYDAHGGLLIILFMLSSVREQSGWSTMTGRVSFERFEALHTSLRALEGALNLSPDDGRMSVVCEATWHMSMIELLLWSTPHTNGVVEGSLDAALAAGTHLTVAQPIIISDQVIESLEPHLQFFLSYLDKTPTQQAMSESPWVTIYSFKAALIAWQLIRAGIGDVASCIGIDDLGNMLDWVKRVFATRTKWGVGRAVLKSLDELEAVSLVI